MIRSSPPAGNDSDSESCSTLVVLLQQRAAHQADQAGYIFLEDGDQQERRLSYRDLDRTARAVSASLRGFSKTGDRALLLFPSGLDFIGAFFGCLYAGVTAVPYCAPRRTESLAGLQAVVASSGASCVLSTTSVALELERRIAAEPSLAGLRWLNIEDINSTAGDAGPPITVRPHDLAFLQYTSGSTGRPKGVMVSHANLLHNQKMIALGFQHDRESVVVGWLPLFHDMGLIGNVLQPLYLGVPCILMSPLHFLQRPVRWLRAVSRYRATTSGGPNFAYEACVRRVTPEQCAGLDLSSWTLAFSGAEPVHSATVDRFAQTFAPWGFHREAFYPCYGMAEATLFVSGGSKSRAPVLMRVDSTMLEQHRVKDADDNSPAQTFVGCGRPWLEQRLAIVDPRSMTRCGENEVGEIWVSGPSVARGYWHQPALSRETFEAFIADTGEGPFLRTGDLGFTRGGELFVTGRVKDMLIIRGRNLYPQDVEATILRSDEALSTSCGAVFGVNVDGEERLAVAHEVERRYVRRLQSATVIANIREAVTAHYGVQAHAVALVPPGAIPRTSSGKVRRRDCAAAFLSGKLPILARVVEPLVARAAERRPARRALDDPGAPMETIPESGGNMSDLHVLQPDEIELDIPGGEPDLQAMRETAAFTEPETRLVDRVFAVIVTFAPPIGFIAALALHFQGWYRIGWIEIGILLTMWFLALAGVELGFHRLFTHGSYKAHRAVRYVFAGSGSMAFQGPVIWWSSVHRKHHRTSDREGDPHSPYLLGEGFLARARGFVHAHIGWIWTADSIRSTGWSRYVWDLYQDEDLFRIHMHYFYWLAAGFVIPAIAGGLLHGSWQGVFLGFLWGGLVRVFLMNHLTYWCINSVTHSRLGTRPYETADRSSNNWLLAIPTMGQTWHNNHHAFPSSSRMGHRWWEIDIGTWILLLLQKLNLVSRMRVPSERMMQSKRRKKDHERDERLIAER